jgi:hypothetical protein
MDAGQAPTEEPSKSVLKDRYVLGSPWGAVLLRRAFSAKIESSIDRSLSNSSINGKRSISSNRTLGL